MNYKVLLEFFQIYFILHKLSAVHTYVTTRSVSFDRICISSLVSANYEDALLETVEAYVTSWKEGKTVFNGKWTKMVVNQFPHENCKKETITRLVFISLVLDNILLTVVGKLRF